MTPGCRRKLLVIDDSATVLAWARQVLESAGYEVVTRSEPMQSAAFILREQPDLVLIDVMMPVLDGVDVVRALRKSDRGKKTRIVLHSSLPVPELEKRQKASGADGIIPKTRNREHLLRLVRRFLEEPAPPVSDGRPLATEATVGAAKSSVQIPVVADSDMISRVIQLSLTGFVDLHPLPLAQVGELSSYLERHPDTEVAILAPEKNREAAYLSHVAKLYSRFKTPMILMGHGSSMEDARAANVAGVTHFLTRPVKVATLRSVFREILRIGPENAFSHERRRAPRLRIPVVVEFMGTPASEVFTWDINEYGAFVCTDQIREVGYLVSLSLKMPHEDKPVDVLARVVHVRPSAVDFFPPGMALSFDPSDDQTKQRLVELFHIS